MSAATFDIVVRNVAHIGWFYLIVKDGIELARGEFKPDALSALMRGQAMAEQLFGGVRK
jgi:hypothetical protein